MLCLLISGQRQKDLSFHFICYVMYIRLLLTIPIYLCIIRHNKSCLQSLSYIIKSIKNNYTNHQLKNAISYVTIRRIMIIIIIFIGITKRSSFHPLSVLCTLNSFILNQHHQFKSHIDGEIFRKIFDPQRPSWIDCSCPHFNCNKIYRFFLDLFQYVLAY